MDAAIYHYLGVFIALVAAGIGFPIPEEIPVVTGGVLAGHPDNHVRWWIMLPTCILGVIISDGLLYGIGRLWGPRLLEYRWVKTRLLPPERLAEIQGNFHKSGVKILLAARLLPAIRSPIFITAGIMKLSFAKFLLADGIYAVPGVSLLFFLGYWFTDQVWEIVHKAESVRPLIVVVVLTAFATWLVLHFMKKPVATGAPEELPPVIKEVTQLVRKSHDTITIEPGMLPDPLPGANGEAPAAPPGTPAVSAAEKRPLGAD